MPIRMLPMLCLFLMTKNEELKDHLLELWLVEWLAALASYAHWKRNMCRNISWCSPEDNNSPFKLSNLIFTHFSNFLSTQTRSRETTKGQPKSLGVASYDMAKSVPCLLYWMRKYDIPAEFSNKLKIFMKEIEWHVAAKKMEDGNSRILVRINRF